MSKYILKHYKDLCIGCGVCVTLASSFWRMKSDNHVSLIKNGFERKDFKINKEARDSCPVNAIRIRKV